MPADSEGDRRRVVAGVILAAGASRRMGRPKQLLSLGGRPLLQHVVDHAASASLGELIVVIGHAAESVRNHISLPDRARFEGVAAASADAGQSASLRAGLRALSPETDAAAVLLGDQPDVTAALIDRVLTAFAGADRPVARPIYSGAEGEARPGHPVVLARRVWDAVARVEGDRGARTVLALHPEWLHEVRVGGAPPEDLDTWADYLRVANSRPDPSKAGLAGEAAGEPEPPIC